MKDQSEVEAPAPLPYPATFENTVRVHAACRAFRIPSDMRRYGVRDALVRYLQMAPLTYKEFAMTFEVVGHDVLLVQTAVTCTRGWGREGVPDWEKIVQYCRRNGASGLA